MIGLSNGIADKLNFPNMSVFLQDLEHRPVLSASYFTEPGPFPLFPIQPVYLLMICSKRPGLTEEK